VPTVSLHVHERIAVKIVDDRGPNARWGLPDLVGAEQELVEIMGRAVDLVERQCVEQSANWIRRRHILQNARTLYVAR